MPQNQELGFLWITMYHLGCDNYKAQAGEIAVRLKTLDKGDILGSNLVLMIV